MQNLCCNIAQTFACVRLHLTLVAHKNLPVIKIIGGGDSSSSSGSSSGSGSSSSSCCSRSNSSSILLSHSRCIMMCRFTGVLCQN